jgi:hypothetical protein
VAIKSWSENSELEGQSRALTQKHKSKFGLFRTNAQYFKKIVRKKFAFCRHLATMPLEVHEKAM